MELRLNLLSKSALQIDEIQFTEPGARANAATYPLGVFHLCRGRVAQLIRSVT